MVAGVLTVFLRPGGDKAIDVIDVARQADCKMKLSEFIRYFTEPHRPKVLNLISLEFSDTKMSELVVVPDVAQKMSWVENYWPDDSFFPKPFVQKYCLMGVKDSYTDFHIDFGGTSVWYHVLWGEKVFYLIKPTPSNLAQYEAWSSSPNQSEVFFGDKVDKCYKCVVPQGTTLLIPTGWIHGVLTSQDCMAFGGNFLHNLNIGMQLRCYEMERRLKTPDLFKFPYFEAICWYVAKNLLEMLKELREDGCPPPFYLSEGVKALIGALKTWLKREVTGPSSEVPDNIRPNHLIKELSKEIRHLEEEPVNTSKPSKPAGSVCGSTSCPTTRSTIERLCQARRARRAARRLREQQCHTPKLPTNLDILEKHTREVLRRLEVGPLEEDQAFCSKVHAKLNKVSTASAAAATESLEENHLRLLLVNGRIIRDVRRPTGPPQDGVKRDQPGVKAEPSDLDSDSDSPTLLAASLSTSSSSSSPSSSDEDDGSESQPSGPGRTIQLHPHKRERPTSPSTEDAIQGMLSMAGLLCPSQPGEGGPARGSWWAGPRSQADHSPMDSQGNSSEAWDSQGPPSPAGPDADYQYCDPAVTPPLHPSKRHAPDPPPVSNQATKGKRPKKGMATAKQRLGKILKLNRHSRVFV